MSYQIPHGSRTYDVTGLGNALVDALVRIDQDSILAEMSLDRGHMHPVSHDDWETAFHQVERFGAELQSGGSCANTIAALGLMGARSIYCGQIGDDPLGKLYSDRLQEACGGHALRISADMPTGKCLSIISGADAERTMLSDLGAAIHLPGLGDFADQIRDSRVLHLTGYLLLGEPMRSRALEAIAIAKAAGVPVSIDAADPFVVETVGELMWQVIRESADIVFLNAEEAETLCGVPAEEALAKVAAAVDTVVVKLGSRGSVVSHRGETFRAGVHKVEAIDTTGAGDAYAAGFLYGLIHDWSPAEAADLGSRIAAMTVAQIGAVVRDRDSLAEAVRAAHTEG
ncbi:MAG: sugar/nucleoside kinase (ribokinase family) [Myxococcota bacterium]